jgi:hypothetical protein
MRTKGMAFLGRRLAVVSQFGESRWNAFLQAYAEIDPFFSLPVLATTLIPTEKFLAFNDRVVDAFFGGDQRGLWIFGEISAHWVLTSGPYQSLRTEGDPTRFATNVPRLWSAYHDEGLCEAVVLPPEGAGSSEIIEISLREVPIHHVYFEFGLIGFLRRGFELVMGHPLSHARLRGFSQGDDDVLYRLKKAPPA